MANTYRSSSPQPPDSSVGAGVPNFYVSPVPSVAVPDNQNLGRDTDIREDALQGIPSMVPAWQPGVYEVVYSPTDLGVVMAINRAGDQVSESGLGLFDRS